MRFFQPKEEIKSKKEQDYQTVLDIVKYYDRVEFNKFLDGVKLGWEGYDKCLRARTRDEKEVKPVDDLTNSFIETGDKNVSDK